MGKVLRVLRSGDTRNQSAADYSRENLFIKGNRYYEGIAINTEVADVTIEEGILVMRDPADTTRVKPIVLTADLSKVIGIVAIPCDVVLSQNDTLNINYAHKGDVDGSLLVLPEVSTLNTLVGDFTLKDLLTQRGFNVLNVTDLSKFDN